MRCDVMEVLMRGGADIRREVEVKVELMMEKKLEEILEEGDKERL